MASLGRAASMSSKKFADAMGSAAAATPKPPIRSRSTTARERWHKCRIHAIALSRASKSRISTIALSRASDCRPVVRALGDGKLVRSEFVDLCIDVMWGLPVANLEMAVQNYLGAKSMETRRNQAYWQAYGRQLDAYCRFWICVPYSFMMCFLFSI